MRKAGILLVAAALGLMVVQTAMSGRGAVRGGMRGAVVGNAVGGSDGASTGAKVGVVTGATKAAIGREATARGTYQSTTEYQDAPRSNFAEAPPDVLGAGSAAGGTKPSGEAVIRKDGRAVVGITFPEDWKQKTGTAYIAAVSKDGQCYAVLATLGVDDKAAGIKKVKAGLENHIKEIKFDEQAETKGGALIVTGTGKGKKAGIPVVFAAAIFEADKGQVVGAAFVVDSKIEEHYKETVSGICQTLRRAKDFDKDGK